MSNSMVATPGLANLSVVISEARHLAPRTRDPDKVVRTVLATVMADPATAIGCIYAVPREGKVIRGPSVRLAEVLRYAWGGIWIEEIGVQEYHDYVVARAMGLDILTSNLTCAVVPQRIINREQQRYDIDGILFAMRAAMAKAKRNVILDLIPANLVSNRVIISIRSELASRREDIERNYHEALAALAHRHQTTVENVFKSLEQRLGIRPREPDARDNKELSTDWMLTVIEYANAVEDMVVSPESHEGGLWQETESQPLVTQDTERTSDQGDHNLKVRPVTRRR